VLGNNKMLLLALVAIVAVAAQPAWAGLATDPLAYNDGVTWWHGSTPFASSDLNGTVEWAVYAPGVFPFAGLGYTPPATEMTYVYQIVVAGPSPVSTLDVAFVDAGRPKDTIGAFPLGAGEWAPTEMALNPTTAHWFFAGIPATSSSYALVFASPNKPEPYIGSLVNEGLGAIANPLPSPSTIPFPEPSTVTLTIVGLLSLGSWWLVRRGKK
jgi:hypothetical protein